MAVFARHDYKDWCHICGNRNYCNADVWYPENAEGATKKSHNSQRGKGIKYIRICALCAETILENSTCLKGQDVNS